MKLDIQSKCTDLRLNIEAQQKNAESEYQKTQAKRQLAAARLHHAKTKKLELEVESTRELDDLKLHLDTIKEQLRNLIALAHKEQEEVIRIDEERNKDEEYELMSKSNIDNIEIMQNQNQNNNLIDDKKIIQNFVEKKKKLNKKSKKNKKTKSRLNTPSGAQIIRPQLKNDTIETV